MVEVTATIENRDGEQVIVTKTEEGDVSLLSHSQDGLASIIVASGNDIVKAILAVGGFGNGFPFGMPGVYPEKEGAQ